MIYTIENENLKLSIYNVGASIVSMQYKHKGAWLETTLRYEDLNVYSNGNPYYLNSIIGPHSGRIKDGVYTYNGKTVELETNDRGNHLHGGSTGFHTLTFKLRNINNTYVSLVAQDTVNACDVGVTFSLEKRQVIIEFDVLSHQEQVINMTQHTYFNLSQEDTIENHEIQVLANRYSVLDDSGVPIRLESVSGPFDLRDMSKLKDKMGMSHPQFDISSNIDHVFEVKENGVRLVSKAAGIGVDVNSDRDYVVVYTGNYFLGEAEFKGMGPSKLHQAIAIEPQHLPNDINLGLNTSQIIEKDAKYTQKITYSFFSL